MNQKKPQQSQKHAKSNFIQKPTKCPRHSTQPPDTQKQEIDILEKIEEAKQLSVQIDFGTGQLATIIVRPFDDPDEIAKSFCGEHGFSLDLVKPLAHRIKLNMSHFFAETSHQAASPANANSTTKVTTMLTEPSKPLISDQSRWASPNLETLQETAQIENNQLSQTADKSLLQQLAERSATGITNRAEQKVYDRLYNMHKLREAKKENLRKRQDQKRSKSKNLFEVLTMSDRMYQRDIYAREIQLQRGQEVKKQRDQIELQKCTFSPKIKRLGQTEQQPKKKFKYINSSDQLGSGLETEYRLMNYATDRKNRIAEIIKQREQDDKEAEKNQCTFKPELAPKTYKLIQKKGYGKIASPNFRNISNDYNVGKPLVTVSPLDKKEDKFSQLYQESQLRHLRQDLYRQVMDKECTFKPQLNKSSINKYFRQRSQSTTFQTPLKKDMCETLDPRVFTFTPKVIRDEPLPRSKRQRSKVSISRSMKLYDDAARVQEKRFEQERQSQVSPVKISERSRSIVEKQKMEVFIKLFRELDNDKDNMISADAVDIQGIQLDVIKILKPIFEELDNIEDGINQQEFVEATSRLYDILDQSSRNCLLSAYRERIRPKEDPDKDCTFHPRLNRSEYSIQSSHRTINDMYERQVSRSQAKEVRIQKERDLKELEEVKECTFQPKLNRSTSRSKSVNMYERQMTRKIQRDAELERKRQERDNELQKQFTFQPNILKRRVPKVQESFQTESESVSIGYTMFQEIDQIRVDINSPLEKKFNDSPLQQQLNRQQNQIEHFQINPRGSFSERNESQDYQILIFQQPQYEIEKLDVQISELVGSNTSQNKYKRQKEQQFSFTQGERKKVKPVKNSDLELENQMMVALPVEAPHFT